MNRIVTVVVLGQEIQTLIVGAKSDNEARQIAIDSVSASFSVRAVTPVQPKRRTSLWNTYKDGFKNFVSRFDAQISE